MVDFEGDITVNTFLAGCCHLLEASAVDVAVRVVFVGCNAVVVVACEVEVVYPAAQDIDSTVAGRFVMTLIHMSTR